MGSQTEDLGCFGLGGDCIGHHIISLVRFVLSVVRLLEGITRAICNLFDFETLPAEKYITNTSRVARQDLHCL